VFLKRALIGIAYTSLRLFARKATPVLHLKLAQGFDTSALRKWRLLVPAAESLRLRVFKGANTAVIGAVAGWGAVVVLGAALLTGAWHEAAPAAPAPAVASVSAPAGPAPVVALAKPVAAPAPIPTPAPTKVTQRIDMSPTASIAETPKPHHKPHKKKTKDLDNSN
jgi:hypothetical protein